MGISVDVVQTKLAVPSLPNGWVARPRLYHRLDAHTGRVTLISAPAGFGKTALVVDWLRRRNQPFAWLSLDRLDNDPARFEHHLASTDYHNKSIIVFDDVHEIDNERVLNAFERLIDPLAAGPRIILLARVDPPMPMARMRMSGELLELRENDLRFDAAECAALFAHLDNSLVSILHERTEGWAAGLRMADIALRDCEDPSAAVASFAGSNRLIVDYLLEEAVHRQPTEVQQFLYDTSVLQRFTVEACREVTGNARASELLNEIEAANLFIVPLGLDRHWYRYHHLFRELLEFRLHRADPVRHQVLHARASDWFAEHGDVHSAIEHACQLKSSTKLIELLEAFGMNIIARSELGTLARWLERVPAPLEQPFPMLVVVLGWIRVLTERAPDLHAILAAGERAIERVGPQYPQHLRARARLQLDVLQGFAARFAGRLEEALQITDALHPIVPRDEPFVRGLVTYNLARLRMQFAEMQEAARLFDDAFEENLRSDTLYLLLTGLGQRSSVTLQLEGVEAARRHLASAFEFANARRVTTVPAFSALLYHAAAIEMTGDNLEAAAQYAQRAVDIAATTNFPEGHANGLLVLFRVALAERHFDLARQRLTALAALAQNRNILLMDSTIELEQFRFALECGEPLLATPASLEGNGRWTIVSETAALLALRHALRDAPDQATLLADRLNVESSQRGRGVALAAVNAAVGDASLARQRGYAAVLREYAQITKIMTDESRNQYLNSLTEREREVLQCLLEGLSNKAMSRRLSVSPETIKTHLKHVYGKLGVSTRHEVSQILKLPR